MKKLFLIFFAVVLLMPNLILAQDNRYFEMRTYTAHEGKRPDLIKRFQDHTLTLFEKNGIENIAYFIPTDETNNTLTFILAYPDKDSRDVLWNKFANSPEWQAAHKASEANGPLVAKVDQVFMENAPDLTPEIVRDDNIGQRIFELRTYYMLPGKVDAIHARFRDYTRELFQKHGMINVMYWYTVEKDPAVQTKLVYLLAHKNEKAGKASFEQFGKDPSWIVVRDASEQNGKIVEKITSVYLKPLPFSPLK
ncbi:NIPSNAP family protein [Aquiflexum sp. TKW24L]|uniref:NIPSNAP family protein n=1 Tax=Aquiflexum sp. TKW24L TaxID=2942212 RepID=UPI0020BF8D06|nr:NIPSNAP family protein [Aquiflexum sp. TKW24L]MCL6261267.1 NIPSNAP family protein [Aquiflexum sp. TKW24L]